MTPSANNLATVDSGDAHFHVAGDDQWLSKQPPGPSVATVTFENHVIEVLRRRFIRAVLLRFLVRQKIIRMPIPLTGATALRAEVPWYTGAWSAAS